MKYLKFSVKKSLSGYLSLFLICLMLNNITFSQTPSDSSTSSGYTLFAPLKSTTSYLIDIDGNVSKTWTSSYRPGVVAYILDDQSLLISINKNNSVFGATGGAGGGVEKYDWSGNLTWSYTYSTATYCSHHDIEVLPNGNILMIAWEKKTENESIAAGRNPSLITEGALWPDHIIEVQPDGTSSGTIIWEWHVWDHLIQDYSSSKENYGTIANHPELIDLNYISRVGIADWNHINSIAYNEKLNQIVLSVHSFSKIWVIDHKKLPVTAVDCEWKRSIALYNKKTLADAHKAGTSTSGWLATNPLPELICTLNVQTILADGTSVNDNLSRKLVIAPPEISTVENPDGTALGDDELRTNSIIVIKGKY